MASKRGKAWKMERASVSVAGSSRPRSNKYSPSDSHTKPAAGSKEKIWVGGYTRTDGSRVHGYYRSTPGN